ncbi:DUF1501 domain-containing protein [Falsihalocynthiibacter sp. S25ZX9]|uniref:DUF1501 domain-containing protein n=1 Tax=Falsihalocynthiibacter sp. S25ZX9 TaxID=3240870 RepID=UPI00350F1A97
MSAKDFTRRKFLVQSSFLGCSLAASPLITPISLASTPSDHRLVVIILRGGLDGLDVVGPFENKEYSTLRPSLLPQPSSAIPLGGMFFMHPDLLALHPLWEAGELGFAHAVSTPYRDKRSHFDGQDILEAGMVNSDGQMFRDGWLNRLLQHMPKSHAQTAFTVGRYEMLLAKGEAEISNWAPDTRLDLTEQAKRLLEISYQNDPLFRNNLAEAIALTSPMAAISESLDPLEAMQKVAKEARNLSGYENIAAFAAARLLEETRIASFSINGWDTHRNQRGALKRALRNLSDVILRLKNDLGPIWEKTAIVAMTEFGRTAHENGTKGTDHGTGGLSILVGGALNGKQVYGDWPGLREQDLYQGRDLNPTQDVRAYAAMAIRGMFGTNVETLEKHVFPGLDLSGATQIIR